MHFFSISSHQGVSYVGYTLQSFKTKLIRTLMFGQGLCLNLDPNWLPNINTNIYSDISMNPL